MYIIALFRLLITYNAHCDKTIWRKVWQLQVDQEIPALDLQKQLQLLALQGHLPFLWHVDLLLMVLGSCNYWNRHR